MYEKNNSKSSIKRPKQTGGNICKSYHKVLLLLLSRFSRVRLCDPIDSSPPGSPIPGILQAEYWSGLLFPSPMHENEKGK